MKKFETFKIILSDEASPEISSSNYQTKPKIVQPAQPVSSVKLHVDPTTEINEVAGQGKVTGSLTISNE